LWLRLLLLLSERVVELHWATKLDFLQLTKVEEGLE
jgi:hypothetical protein